MYNVNMFQIKDVLKNKNWAIIKGDCLTTLKQFSDDSINHIITSPPYNMNLRVRGNSYCSRQIVKELTTKYEGFDDNLPIEQYFQFHKEVITEMLRVTTGYIFYVIQPLTGNKRALFKLMGEFNQHLKEVIIWDKKNAQPAIGESVLNSQFEFILVFCKDNVNAMKRQFPEKIFKRGTLSNVWNIGRSHSKTDNHAATFPEQLVETIVKNFTSENEIILDPFSGTGTTSVVCIKNNRKTIGIELVDAYYDFSIKQLKETEKHLK